MFLFKFWSYLVGYVIISVEGSNLEKFINMALSRGIYIWDGSWQSQNKLTAKVRLSGFMALRHVARKLHCRMRIRGKNGLPFLYARLGKRKALVAGAVACLISLYVLSSFVWFIDVKGTKHVTKARISQIARKEGLYRGALKWKINSEKIEKSLGDQVPELAWVSLRVKGTRALIEVAEKEYPTKRSNKPAHIVASKDGIIKEVLVLTGAAVVNEGDTVKKGQMLITGIIEPELPEDQVEPEGEQKPEEPYVQERPKYLRAEGLVRARVWYKGYGEAPVVQEGMRPTGRFVSSLCIKIGTKEIIVKGPKTPGYKGFKTTVSVKKLPKWRNISIPVELITTKYYELTHFRHNLGHSGAYRLAALKALKEVKAKLPPKAKILKQKVKEIDTGDTSLVRAQVIIESLEEIGVTREYRKPTQ